MPKGIENRHSFALKLSHRLGIHNPNTSPATRKPRQKMPESRGEKKEESFAQLSPLFRKR
jgi:hypothetical protein